MTSAQVAALEHQRRSGIALQRDQLHKIARRSCISEKYRHLKRLYPDVFFTLADTLPTYSHEDCNANEQKKFESQLSLKKLYDDMCGSGVCYGRRTFQRFPNHASAIFLNDRPTTWSYYQKIHHTIHEDDDHCFHLPLWLNPGRNARVLFTCHDFDLHAAQAISNLAANFREVMLSKYALLQPIRNIMQEAQPHVGRLVTNMFVRYLEPEFLHRIVASPLTADVKFKVALSTLEQQQPELAEMLIFQLHELNRFATNRPLDVDSYDFGDVSAALANVDVQNLAVAGELDRLPVWLQGLPCSSVVNETASIEVTCALPTKVYMLCLSEMSHPQSLQKNPWMADARRWTFETSDKFFKRYNGMLDEREHVRVGAGGLDEREHGASDRSAITVRKFQKSKAADCLVCSMMLDSGVYKLDTTDAIYFFDTQNHVKQQLLRASGAPLCKFMQRDGCCSAGDCCKYSHAPPRYFSPQAPVYICYMLQHCMRSIRCCLRQHVAGATPSTLSMQLYSKFKGYGHFAVRRRVLPSGMIKALILRLICARGTAYKVQVLAATQLLPMRIYRGFMTRMGAEDADDEDAGTYIERGGYRFRTLFNHRHSRQARVLESGALFYVGGGVKAGECGIRELPDGWEVCPPDAISIAVCTQHWWQSTALALADGRRYATLGCPCRACAEFDSSQKPRQPHTDRYFITTMKIKGRWVEVEGTDVLIRRRVCACSAASVHAASAQIKITVAPAPSGGGGAAAEIEAEKKAVRDLADLLARCCLARANPEQTQRIQDFLEKNQ